MSKRMQLGSGEARIVAKSKPTLNLVPRSVARSPTAPSSSASSRPGTLRAPSQECSNLTAQCAGKLDGENLDINDEDDSKWLRNLGVSRANVPHREKIYANLRRQLKREDRNSWHIRGRLARQILEKDDSVD